MLSVVMLFVFILSNFFMDRKVSGWLIWWFWPLTSSLFLARFWTHFAEAMDYFTY
jgi:hypothetical protein